MFRKCLFIYLFMFCFAIFVFFTNKCNFDIKQQKEPFEHAMTEQEFLTNFGDLIVLDPLNSGTNMLKYFKNLNQFSPMNSFGSCGYVSIIQLLSYYDTFLNDSIIPEQHECNQGNRLTEYEARLISPGVLRQAYPQNSTDLYNFIQLNKASDYQMYLMDIVNQYDNHSSSEYSYSIGMWNYYKIFESINTIPSNAFSYTDVNDITPYSNDPRSSTVVNWFDSYVKSQLDLNRPVVLHIKQFSGDDVTFYHSVVAYYYDEDGIHANFGWGSTSTDVIIGNDSYISEAGIIDTTNISTVHSDNYIIDNELYCGCGQNIPHNYLNHDFSDHYSTNTNDNHKSYCECGEFTYELHVVLPGMSFQFNGHTYAFCVLCHYKVNLDDAIVIIYSIEDPLLLLSNQCSTNTIMAIYKKEEENYL